MSKKSAGFPNNLAILGGGNIGQALARGMVHTKVFASSHIWISRRRLKGLNGFRNRGFNITTDNRECVKNCRTLIIAVQPAQAEELLTDIASSIQPRKHLILSAVTGLSIASIRNYLPAEVPIVRIMPNTAVAIGESMTCLSSDGNHKKALEEAVALFDKLGRTLVIAEEHMLAATALCACGIAFFLRSIRAASQGGIQTGFHADEALKMAAQTARGAASLLIQSDIHPESEIDKVTTPRGCTIAGLNQMEHAGFSSAMIKGLVTAAEIATSIFPGKK